MSDKNGPGGRPIRNWPPDDFWLAEILPFIPKIPDNLQRLNDASRNVFKTYWPLMVLALVVVLFVALAIVGVVAAMPEGSTISRGDIP